MKTTLEIPEEIYRELKVRAAREGTTMTKIISSALEAALERPGRAAPPQSARPGGRPGKEDVVVEAASRRLEKASKRQDAASTVSHRHDWDAPGAGERPSKKRRKEKPKKKPKKSAKRKRR